MHYLYIIYSKTLNRFYVGETSNLAMRIEDHNNHKYTKAFTKAAKDWTIQLQKECKTKNEAIFLEQFIKRMKSKKFILKVIKEPTILDDILSKK